MSLHASKYLNKLVKQRVLVFGGTSGIGFCVAEAAIEHGADVIISNSNQERLDKALGRLRTSYPNAPTGQITGYTTDLSDSDNLEANLQVLLKKCTQSGKLNHIAFTAGDSNKSPAISKLVSKDFYASGTVRSLAPLMLAKVLPEYMDLSPANSFTITGGTNGDRPFKGRTLMASWSTFQEGLMRGMAVDLQPLRVNMVSPGAIQTELWNAFSGDALEEFAKKMADETTVKEVGKPEQIAEAYLYFMKDRFASGEIIRSNGGRLLANSFGS